MTVPPRAATSQHILAFAGVTLLAAVVLLTAAGLMLKVRPPLPQRGEKFGRWPRRWARRSSSPGCFCRRMRAGLPPRLRLRGERVMKDDRFDLSGFGADEVSTAFSIR